jgi:hypothetical protein
MIMGRQTYGPQPGRGYRGSDCPRQTETLPNPSRSRVSLQPQRNVEMSAKKCRNASPLAVAGV